MARSPDPAVWQRWRRLLALFDPEQFTVAEFCRLHDISTASFYTWRRKLRQTSRARHESRYPTGSGFIPVEVRPSATGHDEQLVQVHLPGNARLEIPAVRQELVLATIQALVDRHNRQDEEV